MTINVTKNDEQILITMAGNLDTLAAEQADAQIKEVETNVTKPIVIDCTELDYVASAGLRLLIRIRKAASAMKQTVTLLNINANVKEVLSVTHFDRMFILA